MHSQIAQSQATRPRVSHKTKSKRRRYRLKRKKKFEELTAENRYLKGIIEGLISDYMQGPARALQNQEDSVAQSACQNDHPSFYLQDHQGEDSNFGGTTEWLDGLGLDDLPDDVLSVENPNNSLNTQKNTVAEFLKKIDEDVASSVHLTDFMICLDQEHKTIGRYSFPLSLVPTVQKIINVYGDVSSGSLMSSDVTGRVYLFFCATIKEMEDLELHHVTEEKLLKWRDAIKDALRINFKVGFAMHHLKRIACAYFGHVGSQVLQTIDEKLNALRKERARTYQDFKDCLAEADDFRGKSVSTGLFP
ncbi:hypothetical protein DITRI_Ditri07aG0018300 [Diplodiscus trichospermus]